MTNRRKRRGLHGPLLLAALGISMAGGCMPVDGATVEMFAMDLLRSVAAAFLL